VNSDIAVEFCKGGEFPLIHPVRAAIETLAHGVTPFCGCFRNCCACPNGEAEVLGRGFAYWIRMNTTSLIHISPRNEEELWNVVVETHRGVRHKFKYDSKLHVFCLHHTLPEGMAFPYDFGFLPGTSGEDGDPLDVLLLLRDPTFCGCVVPAHLIGVIEA